MRTMLLATLVVVGLAAPARAQDVTVTQNDRSFILSNGIVTAEISKRTGDMTSMKVRLRRDGGDRATTDGREMLESRSGHAGAYWSHDTTGGKELVTRITIDPGTNGGARAEVSVKAISGGIKMGHGPGAAPDGDFPADIEIRWTLGRGDTGIYTYCIFDHRPEYPAATMTEARFAAKLAETFDWMTVDRYRDQPFPKDLREGDKYIYTAVQFENRAFGWSSTKERIGFWLLNPSVEFLSGGPTKVEFLAHRDTTAVAAPIVFNYWRSSHYGGAAVEVGTGERWTKTIGPFFLYVNEDGDPQTLARDARARQLKEASQWPYEWVSGVESYAPRQARATVTGRLLLRDSYRPETTLPNLLVGLTAPAYTSPVARGGANGAAGANGASGPRRVIDWQTDAKHYQFWVRGDADGTFSIPDVPAGTYTLRALADGVLGEFAQAAVTVKAGAPVDLGSLTWTPVRHGRPLWEVGVPNRTATEFAGADRFWKPEMPAEYAQRFPRDVQFVIGRSDPGRDWYFQHVPHLESAPADAPPPRGGTRAGRATPYTISFDVTSTLRGTAILRAAICGTGVRQVQVAVNGQPVGTLDGLLTDGAIARHSIQGLWYEREVAFDAALLKPGTNTVTLTVPAGPVTNGVIYDYLRLELQETAAVPARAERTPTIFIAGDSTAARGAGDRQQGWGEPFAAYVDPAKVTIDNRARGGRSSRTFITEGLWDALVADLRAGDTVLIQFGHNDGGPINDEPPPPLRARGSLPGLGDETRAIDNVLTKKPEVVRTFGWYMRRMIADVRAKGASPIVLSLTVRNRWENGRIERGSGRYSGWSYDIAKATAVPFIDVTNLAADRLEALGPDPTAALYPQDHTHFNAAGADLHAQVVVAGLKGLRPSPIENALADKGRAVPAETFAWLRLPRPENVRLPSLFLVGDSTVRNGRGDGVNGEWGWGDYLAPHLDTTRINVVNRAVGGTGARTFRTIGHWPQTLALVQPGDVVVIQFGHNDNGARGALPGTGTNTETRANETTKEPEIVETFGAYLRRYVADVRAHGAVPILATLVPRNIWQDGRIARSPNSHADWTREVAAELQVPLIDLHERIAQRYDTMGAAAVRPLFADERVHTDAAGAELSAEIVAEALRTLEPNPLAAYLR